ncbi:MAG: hypothetical protein JWM91_5042 [Rhodospirillales bacterium]|nr:hypothetical protein [Rhodospirillales bacterium]
MLKRFGFTEAIFSINSFIAAMLALYIIGVAGALSL